MSHQLETIIEEDNYSPKYESHNKSQEKVFTIEEVATQSVIEEESKSIVEGSCYEQQSETTTVECNKHDADLYL